MDQPEREPQRASSAVGLRIHDVVERAEGAPVLDRPAAVLDRVAAAVRERDRRGILRGAQMGHALHPALVLLPIGCWVSAGLLDVIGRGNGVAARRLTAVGVLGAAPAVATGLVEYTTLDDQEDRRVAVVHAAGNALAVMAYTKSWWARRRGRRLVGIVAGIVGAVIVGGTGHLGGHLAYVRGAGHGRRDVGDAEPIALPAVPAPVFERPGA